MLDRTGLNHVALSGVSAVASALCRVRAPRRRTGHFDLHPMREPTFLPQRPPAASAVRYAYRMGNPARRASAGAAWRMCRILMQRRRWQTMCRPVDGMVIALKFTARLDLAEFFGRLLASRLSSRCRRLGRCHRHSGAAGVRASARSAGSINRTISHALSLSLLDRRLIDRSIAADPTHTPATISGAERAATQCSRRVCRGGQA